MKSTWILYVLALGLAACGGGDKSSHHAASPADAAPMDHSMHMTNAPAGYADSVNQGLIATDTLKGSPARVAMGSIGPLHMHITYHSPGVKGRIIWGGLVPYGQVWVTGAHTATNMRINHPVHFGETIVDTGTYAIYTIPAEGDWTFILNRNYAQHLADDYTEKDDVLRLPVTVKEGPMTPRLTYQVEVVDATHGILHVRWEKKALAIPFQVKS
jgi:hypothetical protein